MGFFAYKKQINECRDCFSEISSFKNYKSIILDVGGVRNEMLKYGKYKATIKFKVPRSSLMKSIRREIFDDLLIGNFMKTQIINGHNLITLTSLFRLQNIVITASKS